IKLDEIRTQLLKKNEHDSDHDFYMGSNCRFLNSKNNTEDKPPINPSDEHNFCLSEIVSDSCLLYISQNSEFDLTVLRFEKGLKLNEDGSITTAHAQAFHINIDRIKINKNMTQEKNKEYECTHKSTTDCKCTFLLDGKLPVVCLSYENSSQAHTNHTMKNQYSCQWVQKGEIRIPDVKIDIEVTDGFVKDVEKALDETIQDKKSQLFEVSKKYGDFYARSLILGGTIIKNEKYTKNSGETSKLNKINGQTKANVDTEKWDGIYKVTANVQANAQADYDRSNIKSFITTNNDEIIIGGDETEDKITWRKSLKDQTTWKIIGYKDYFSLFELLEEPLRNKVLGVLGHQILKENERQTSVRLYAHYFV
ncbi:16290_t:CDS:2, partial [Racocetra fulgida]